jgi:hypothetical protein
VVAEAEQLAAGGGYRSSSVGSSVTDPVQVGSGFLLVLGRLGPDLDPGHKGIVLRDFEVCFLIPLDSSDIVTLDGTGSFF